MAGHGAHHGGENKGVALLISVLALFLAVAEMGAKSSQTEALNANVQAANLWSFFQARTIRQTRMPTTAEGAKPPSAGKANPRPAKAAAN